jgi:rare lipoprotein A (peptidoglycan hydrolase)
MRRLAEGLAILLSVASLGAVAASGPSSLEAAKVTPQPVVMTGVHNTRTNHTTNNGKSKSKGYQVGTASWYGEQFQGKETASGEPYDMRDFTAAHPSLPLGTFVRVTNLKNGKAVVVRINDRGPVVDGRIIDVSYNAARALGFDARGVQQVRLDLFRPTHRPVVNGPTTVALLQPVANFN